MPGRRNPDLGALRAAAAGPGTDTRVWLVLGIVKERHTDTTGVYVDVSLIPEGTIETALVGTGYAGGGFGDWRPIKVDDTVLIAYPLGDPAQGPIVIARLWSTADPPPPELGVDTDPTDDPVTVVEAGRTLRVVCRPGASVVITTDVTGKVVVDSPDVRLGGVAPTEPALLGNELLDQLLSGAIVATGTGPSSVLVPAPGNPAPWATAKSSRVKVQD